MVTIKRLVAVAAWGLCVAAGPSLADTPVGSLADGRTGRIDFSVPAGNSTLASLVNRSDLASDTIWGVLLMPEGATGMVPAMVISHGSGGLGALSYEWAEMFASMGIASFVIDHFDGRGFSNTSSDQSKISSSVIPADGLVALGLLATHPRIDVNRIGHIGFSKGGHGAVVSGYERMRAAILPDATRFALHLAFYPGGRVTADRLAGSPIRIFMGDLDDYETVESTRAMVDHLRAAGGDAVMTVYPGAYHAFDATFPPTWVANAQTSKSCPTSTNIDTLVTIDPMTGSRIVDVNAYLAACRTLGVRLGNGEPARSQSRQAVWTFVRQQFGLAGISGTVALPAASALNYTAQWWNPAESGWGINFNHQGDIVFGTLFTYDAKGAPLWLVMSAGMRLGTSSTHSGDLYRATGPAFNANPFTPISSANLTRVGTMTVTFSSVNSATLVYGVDGFTVSKSIERQVYGTRAATCSPTRASRASATNFQDLWWNAAESGWGLNLTHQDNTIFATLFTYDASGRDLWLVMSAGIRQSDGTFLGELYRASGPPFNAVPFTPITIANLASVGTMRLWFSDGNRGTVDYGYLGAAVTKSIIRQEFASPVPVCQ